MRSPASAPPAVSGASSDLERPANLHPLMAGRIMWFLFGLCYVTVVGLWASAVSSAYLMTVPGALVELGRLAGLSGGYALLVLVLLSSRLSWLTRVVGSDRLVAWHRRLGGWTVVVIAVHVVAITLGYAATFHHGPTAQLWDLIRGYPDVLAALVAFGLLVGIGVISIRAIRRRLAYETWYYLHLYTYLALALVFSHQFADGQQFVTSHGATVFWACLYVATALAVVYGRLYRPLRSALLHRMRVSDVVEEAPGVYSVYVVGRRLETLRARPGQFMRWRFLTREGWWQAHPFSLSAAPSPYGLRLTARDVGDHTHTLGTLRPGTRVAVEGPYGGFVAASRTRERTLLIAGGVGITPVRALLEELAGAPGGTTLVYRVRRAEDVLFREELQRLVEARGVSLHIIVGRRGEAAAADALSADGLRSLVPDVVDRDVYVCGPAGMVTTVVASLRRLRVPRRQLHLESFEF